MNKKEYKSRYIDTTDVKLPKEMEELAEVLAKNVHEVWFQTRIKQGWTYGEERNDLLKKHPCLIDYEKLSEDEKEFDRNTSQETLRTIIKLGYKIVKQ